MERRRTRRPKPASAVHKIQLDRRDRWHQERWPRPTFASAWPLAERYEALLRVFNNPQPFARRLARALHALPHRARELCRAPEQAQHRIEDWDVFDVSAHRAWSVADTS